LDLGYKWRSQVSMPMTTCGRKPPLPLSYGCKISGECGMPPAQTKEQSRPSITTLSTSKFSSSYEE